MPSKVELRRRFRAERERIDFGQLEVDSGLIREQMLSLPECAGAQSVFVYASAGHEVQTQALIEALLSLGKTVAVPRITDAQSGQMQAVVIRSWSELVPAEFGILTPTGNHKLAEPADLSLIPGLAFSPVTGARLGMGGGYYDRFFAAQTRPTFRVGLALYQQLCDDIPAEPHDVSVHAIVTPTRIIRTSAPTS